MKTSVDEKMTFRYQTYFAEAAETTEIFCGVYGVNLRELPKPGLLHNNNSLIRTS